MEENEEPPAVNFVSCIRWIKKGVARNEPVKLELSRNELAELVKSTSKKLKLGEVADDSENEENEIDEKVSKTSGNDEFDMENYDDEKDAGLNVGDIAVYDDAESDPFNAADDESDSDAEDDIIKPEDNLIVVGHVEGYASSLEIYVYNHFEDSFYVHHDILLPSVPLCIEWLNYDPSNVNLAANLCAVGTMSPIIDVWDIDLINSIEPAYKLGKKGSKKKGIPKIGHTDAVLDLSWNIHLTHILASGSVDKTVLLWDLETKSPHTKLSAFEEKIQSLEWHPSEGQTLVTGCCDSTNKVFDCRSSDHKSWTSEGEVERVKWNRYNPFEFFSSDNLGNMYCFDCRQDSPKWKVTAHTKEVTGLTLSSQCPGFLATASQDGTFKVWDVIGNEPEMIYEKNLKVGGIQCLETPPDDPFLMASGGSKKNMNLIVFNAIDNISAQTRFRSREFLPEVEIEGTKPSVSDPSRIHAVPKKDRVKSDSLKVTKKKKEFKKTK